MFRRGRPGVERLERMKPGRTPEKLVDAPRSFCQLRSNSGIPERITAVRPYATKLKFDSESTLFVMRVAAEGGSGLMKRSEKPGNDPIFGEGISPA